MKRGYFWFGMLENLFNNFEIFLLQVFIFYINFRNLKMKSYYMENLDISSV